MKQPFTKFDLHYRQLWIPLLLSCFLLASCNSLSKAQKNTDNKNSLTLISTVARSDGLGQVVRFHLHQKADSFRVYHAEPHLIQVALFGKDINSKGVGEHFESSIFSDTDYHEIPYGVGIDFQLKEEYDFMSDIYRDGQSDDILLGLTNADPEEVKKLTKENTPIDWSSSTFLAELNNKFDERQPNNNNPEGNQNINKLQFDTIIIDAGHGGHDYGALGYGNVIEKSVVLSIAKKVGGYINENLPNIKVIYTRDDDTFIGLKERGRIANRNSGDLFVSIHANASSSSRPHGTEVYFLGLERSQTALEVMKRENKVIRPNASNKQKKLSQKDLLIYELANSAYISSSERLAGMISQQFSERAQRRSRGVKQARFVVLYHASMPALLVETGFITNPNEAQYLASDYGQNIIASAIFRAIRNYKEQIDRNKHLTTQK